MKAEITFILIVLIIIYLMHSFIFLSFDPIKWLLIGRITSIVSFLLISFVGLKSNMHE